MRRVLLIAVVESLLLARSPTWAQPPQPSSAFTVRDDIALARFGQLAESPKGDLISVQTERACLEDGMVHETVRVYSLEAIRQAIRAPDPTEQVEPLWSFERSTPSGDDSPRISAIKWLPDGTGFGFALRVDQYHRRLFLALVAAKTVIPLSAAGDDVLGFDIRDRSHYVFTVGSHETLAKLQRALEAPFQVGTGEYFQEAAFPEAYSHSIQRGDLWAAVGGTAAPVYDRTTGKPIYLYSDGSQFLSLSPDGKNLVTIRAVPQVPTAWESRFPPPYPDSPYGLKAHRQDLTAPLDGWRYVGEWVRIDLADGAVASLTHAPASGQAGWWETYAKPAWSDDGSSILLPGTFDGTADGTDQRPCVAVVEMTTGQVECVKRLDRNLAQGFEPGYSLITDVSFAPGDDHRVLLKGNPSDQESAITSVYVRSAQGRWQLDKVRIGDESSTATEVKVQESFKDPPVLVATDPVSKRSKVILDPNPQLKNIVFGKAELFDWQDKDGRAWQGILFKPVGFRPNVRYPLVIQNHGFSMSRYLPSGGYPSAFAAEELASAGIMVLQVRDCAGRSTASEGRCNVDGYESAVRKLSRDDMVDPSRVGIIGFSRTVYYVLEALTTSAIQFKAASITDGVTFGYMDYLLSIGPDLVYRNEQVGVIGSEPFGQGLAKWLQSSPTFNFEKVATPLRVVATCGSGVVAMWEPYALLEAMHKPVDLIVLNTGEHVLVDPAVRLEAQGGNVDWFRFWLEDYQDPDPAKAEQYARWRELRDAMSPQ